MAVIYQLLVWALVISYEVVCCLSNENCRDWIDPGDTINYNLATGRMRNSEVCDFPILHGLCVNLCVTVFMISTPNSTQCCRKYVLRYLLSIYRYLQFCFNQPTVWS